MSPIGDNIAGNHGIFIKLEAYSEIITCSNYSFLLGSIFSGTGFAVTPFRTLLDIANKAYRCDRCWQIGIGNRIFVVLRESA